MPEKKWYGEIAEFALGEVGSAAAGVILGPAADMVSDWIGLGGPDISEQLGEISDTLDDISTGIDSLQKKADETHVLLRRMEKNLISIEDFNTYDVKRSQLIKSASSITVCWDDVKTAAKTRDRIPEMNSKIIEKDLEEIHDTLVGTGGGSEGLLNMWNRIVPHRWVHIKGFTYYQMGDQLAYYHGLYIKGLQCLVLAFKMEGHNQKFIKTRIDSFVEKMSEHKYLLPNTPPFDFFGKDDPHIAGERVHWVIDTENMLIWDTLTVYLGEGHYRGRMTREEKDDLPSYANNLKYLGFVGWRLPKVSELDSYKQACIDRVAPIPTPGAPRVTRVWSDDWHQWWIYHSGTSDWTNGGMRDARKESPHGEEFGVGVVVLVRNYTSQGWLSDTWH